MQMVETALYTHSHAKETRRRHLEKSLEVSLLNAGGEGEQSVTRVLYLLLS